MTDSPDRFHIDLSNHSCRIRIDGLKPGKQVKVLIQDQANPSGPPLHGTGALSEDLSVFRATFAGADGERTLDVRWDRLKAELAKYPRYD